MTFFEMIMAVIAVALLIGVIVMTRLVGRIGRAADDVGLAARQVAELGPAAHKLIDAAHTELVSLHTFSRTATGVADDVRSVTNHASAVSSRILEGFESELVDRSRAIFAGARVGLEALRRFRNGNGSHGTQSAEMEEYDEMRR